MSSWTRRAPAASLLVALLVMAAALAGTGAPLSATERIYEVLLFSWPDGEGSWYFALVGGKHPLTDAEIMAEKTRIHGVEELGERFRELPEYAYVFWFHRDRKAFVYPDPATVERAKTLAETAHLNLRLPDARSPAE
jgi:hypothetical protein